MTKKHTPGNWKTDVWNYPDANPPRREVVIVSEKFRLAIMDCNCADAMGNPYTITREEAVANARLMAVSPDLLESLKRLVVLDPRCHNGIEHCGDCAMCQAQAAIAQAEQGA